MPRCERGYKGDRGSLPAYLQVTSLISSTAAGSSQPARRSTRRNAGGVPHGIERPASHWRKTRAVAGTAARISPLTPRRPALWQGATGGARTGPRPLCRGAGRRNTAATRNQNTAVSHDRIAAWHRCKGHRAARVSPKPDAGRSGTSQPMGSHQALAVVSPPLIVTLLFTAYDLLPGHISPTVPARTAQEVCPCER